MIPHIRRAGIGGFQGEIPAHRFQRNCLRFPVFIRNQIIDTAALVIQNSDLCSPQGHGIIGGPNLRGQITDSHKLNLLLFSYDQLLFRKISETVTAYLSYSMNRSGKCFK